MNWIDGFGQIEALEDAEFDAALVADMQANAHNILGREIRFSTPTFKEFESSELSGCGKNSFPAFSITGGACALNCDHCQKKILEPMIPAIKPEILDQKVRDLIIMQDLQGFLLSGGSNAKNEIRYERFLPVIEKLKIDFPHLKVAIHTALTDEAAAKRMESAGVDTAMMDVIGSEQTIKEVYKLDRPVEDFRGNLGSTLFDKNANQPTHCYRASLRQAPSAKPALSIFAPVTTFKLWCWSSSCHFTQSLAHLKRLRPPMLAVFF